MNEGAKDKSKIFKFLLFLLIVGLCIFVGRYFKFDIDYYRALLAQYPLFLSGLIFVLLYTVITTFVWVGPKDVFRITSAILFGSLTSAFFVWIAECINAFILFYVSRKLGREYVEQKLKIRSHDIDKAQERSGFLWVFALRLNPLIPFRMMDLGFGLSNINVRTYFIAIALAMPARILWLQIIIASVGERIFKGPQILMEFLTDNQMFVIYSGLYFLIVLILTIAAFIVQKVRKSHVSHT